MPDDAFDLPRVLPVFPLTGVMLLPGNWLPLNVFEPRYRNLVREAMDGARAIGMIQPVVPRRDNAPPPEAVDENPDLYTVGCAGRISACDPQPDGRFHILLKGVSRFRIREELPLHEGYRRVIADYGDFAADLGEPEAEIDPAGILGAVAAFAKRHGLEFDMTMLAALPGVTLLNGLAVALPFHAAEKQALLEAASPHDRAALLLALMDMGIEAGPAGGEYAPPTLH